MTAIAPADQAHDDWADPWVAAAAWEAAPARPRVRPVWTVATLVHLLLARGPK